MTDKQINMAFTESANYTDPDAYLSDLMLASAFLPEEDTEPDMGLIEPLRRLWRVHNVSFRDFLADLGLSQYACARRFCIPLRTVQSWALGERTCPPYIRLMLAQLMGYAPSPEARG